MTIKGRITSKWVLNSKLGLLQHHFQWQRRGICDLIRYVLEGREMGIEVRRWGRVFICQTLRGNSSLNLFPSFSAFCLHTHSSSTPQWPILKSATALATVVPHDPPENTLLLKLIQNNSVGKNAFWHLLHPCNNFAIHFVKRAKLTKGCFNTLLQQKGTLCSCNSILSSTDYYT